MPASQGGLISHGTRTGKETRVFRRPGKCGSLQQQLRRKTMPARVSPRGTEIATPPHWLF